MLGQRDSGGVYTFMSSPRRRRLRGRLAVNGTQLLLAAHRLQKYQYFARWRVVVKGQQRMRLHEHVGGVPIRQGEQGRLAVNKRALAPREEEKIIELVGLLLPLVMRPRAPCEQIVFE